MRVDGEVPALEARGLSKRYRRGVRALHEVDLTVTAGSITGLVGPNAAGKSTLMKTFVGFERPTAGEVRVHGVDPWRDRAGALSRLGYVPQSPSLYRSLTVLEHLALAAHVRSGFDRAAAGEHLSDIGIPLDTRPSSLSGGQQAQVMLAIALGTGADVLLLDEPLASLDPLARTEFLALLRSAIRQRAATVVLTSHIVTDIQQVCDRLIVLGVGRILFDDALAKALAVHRVLAGDQAVPDGLAEIGRFPDDAGDTITLFVASEGSGAASSGSQMDRPATLDEIVKGYLVAGRRLHRARAA